jgi:membrane protein implicated in regulation of membrane protease activity
MGALWTFWWVWGAAALALGVAELLLPGFVLLGFAIGAGAVALILLTGLTPGLTALLVVFAVLSLLAWIVLRRVFRLPHGQVRFIRDDVNK